MKRKLLSIVLALTMALGMLPAAALAEEEGGTPSEGEQTYVAQIGENKYAKLAEAINAAGTGGTVQLLADITGQTVIPAGKDIVLDLNGKTMTHTGTTLYNSGKLTVRDSSADKSGKIVSTGNVGIGVNHNSTTTIEYANIEAVEGAVITGYATGAKITIENGIFEVSDNAVIAGNGNSTDHSGVERKDANTITINGGKFTGNIKTSGYIACGIYAPWKDIVTVNGGEFTVNNGIGIVARAGQVKVNGGTFTCNGSAEGKVGDKNFNMAAAQCLYFDATDPAYPAYNSATDYIKVTGGIFSSNVSAYVADGYTYNSDTKTVESLGETNSVAKIGDTYYKTLADAYVAASEDGNTEITLLKSTTISSGMEIKKPVTLNLGGNVLTSEGYGFDVYKNFTLKNGTLNTATWGVWVQNSGVKFTLETETVINADCNTDRTNAAGVIVVQQASADIKGKVTAQHNFAVSGNGSDGWGGVTINVMPGAEISTTEDAPALYFPNTTNLTITGGSITGGTGAYVKSGKVTISGGTIIGTGAKAEYKYNGNGANSTGDALVVETCKYPGGAPKVSITGGKFKSVNASAIGSYAGNGETVPLQNFISGGLFSTAPEKAYLAENRFIDATTDSNYPYCVTDQQPESAPIAVTENTEAKLAEGDTVKGADKTAITEALNSSKTSVDGVANAVAPDSRVEIAKQSDVADAVLSHNDNMITVDIKVDVTVTASDLEKGTLTFTATPVATVKVNNVAQEKTVPVTNDMLTGGPITVKLPLPTGFKPEQIKHTSSDNSVEYFINKTEGPKRGAKTFEIVDGCAVFEITKFSTFELSGEITYVEPSSSSSRYNVTAPKADHGTVTVTPSRASKGDTVTVTVKPDSGYVLETITVTDKDGKELALTDKGDGKYTFTMPRGAVTVKATFMEDNTVLNFFYDVPNDAYYYEAVKWAVEKGITSGIGNDLFGSNDPCTRAQIVTFLWRAAGSPEPKALSSFTDVPADTWYAKAVAWAVENGVTAGVGDGLFGSDDTCTRAQSVTFLFKALKAVAKGEAGFRDVASSDWYAKAVAWAVENGVTAGVGDNLFGSGDPCSRAQIVTFLFKAYQGK